MPKRKDRFRGLRMAIDFALLRALKASREIILVFPSMRLCG
jgi:hypothetical protein